MSSRLFQRVREELGLAYAIFAYKHFYQSSGQLGVYVGTQPATADAAVEAIRGGVRAARPGRPAGGRAGGRQAAAQGPGHAVAGEPGRPHGPARGLRAPRRRVPAARPDAGGDRRGHARTRSRRSRRSFSRRSARRSCGWVRGSEERCRRRSGRSMPASCTTPTHHITQRSHAHRRAEGDQDEREPHRAGAGGRRGARRRGTHACSSSRARGSAAASPTRRTRRSGAQILRHGRRGLAAGRDDHEGEGADRGRVAADAAGPGDLHLLPLRRRRGPDPGRHRLRGHRGGLRDGAAPERRAAAAHADVRGGRPDGGAGGRQVPGEGVRRERHPARRRARAWRRARS